MPVPRGAPRRSEGDPRGGAPHRFGQPTQLPTPSRAYWEPGAHWWSLEVLDRLTPEYDAPTAAVGRASMSLGSSPRGSAVTIMPSVTTEWLICRPLKKIWARCENSKERADYRTLELRAREWRIPDARNSSLCFGTLYSSSETSHWRPEMSALSVTSKATHVCSIPDSLIHLYVQCPAAQRKAPPSWWGRGWHASFAPAHAAVAPSERGTALMHISPIRPAVVPSVKRIETFLKIVAPCLTKCLFPWRVAIEHLSLLKRTGVWLGLFCARCSRDGRRGLCAAALTAATSLRTGRRLRPHEHGRVDEGDCGSRQPLGPPWLKVGEADTTDGSLCKNCEFLDQLLQRREEF